MVRIVGLLLGVSALLVAIFAPIPEGLAREGMIVAGLVVLMAAWWITEALPLTATALMPFLVLPFAGVMDARETASAYYSPILFLLLGGAFIVLAIERVGLHRRLSLGILRVAGPRSAFAGSEWPIPAIRWWKNFSGCWRVPSFDCPQVSVRPLPNLSGHNPVK